MWIEQTFRAASWIMGGATIWFLLGSMLSGPMDLLTTPRESAKRAGIFFLLFSGSQILLRFGLLLMLFWISIGLVICCLYQIEKQWKSGKLTDYTWVNNAFAYLFLAVIFGACAHG